MCVRPVVLRLFTYAAYYNNDTCLRIVVEQLRGERGVAVDEKTRPNE